VSARHQVKRPDRTSKRSRLQVGLAEETSFLRSVRTLSLRSFTGGHVPRSEIGPDVFADALASLSRSSARRFRFPKPSKPKISRAAVRISHGAGRPLLGCASRPAIVITRQAGGWRQRMVRAMVIVAPNGRVNRTSSLRTNPGKCGVSRFPSVKALAVVYAGFIAMLKLPFKFDRS